jgi:RNA polymerase sigma factor (sigma-70 family)
MYEPLPFCLTCYRPTGVASAHCPHCSAPLSACLEGGLSDRYQLLRPLGHGAAGDVFLGRDLQGGREVALKLLRDPIGDRNERFLREARVLLEIDHPGVVKVFEIITVGDHPCLVMEYVDGGNLREFLDSQGPLSYGRWLDLAKILLGTLAACHARGLFHRDLKPGNILLAVNGPPRIADFGLARDGSGDDEITLPGAILGTPQYMAPEQLAGDRVGAAADVYAMGEIFVEMLTGVAVYGSSGLNDLLKEKLQPPRLDRLVCAGNLPPVLIDALRQAMSVSPHHRPSAVDLLQTLQKLPARLPPGPSRPASADDLCELTDRELVAIAITNQRAFTEIVRRYQGRVWRLARALAIDANEAEDIAQTAFLRLFTNLTPQNPVLNLGAYLRSIVVRLCADRSERKIPAPAPTPLDVAADGSSLSSHVDRLLRAERLRELLSELTPPQRIAILLRYYEGLSTQEIAEAMDLTPKAVEGLMARARKRLEELFNQ